MRFPSELPGEREVEDGGRSVLGRSRRFVVHRNPRYSNWQVRCPRKPGVETPGYLHEAPPGLSQVPKYPEITAHFVRSPLQWTSPCQPGASAPGSARPSEWQHKCRNTPYSIEQRGRLLPNRTAQADCLQRLWRTCQKSIHSSQVDPGISPDLLPDDWCSRAGCARRSIPRPARHERCQAGCDAVADDDPADGG